MNKNNSLAFVYLSFALLVSACAAKNLVEVPDTQPGDQLKAEYMVGDWCTNRELTGTTNRDAGHSALTNISPVYWRFEQGGDWQVSTTGWMYEDHGSWQLKGLNTLVLDKPKGKPSDYQANFKDDGADLYLEDDEAKFLVLSVCE
jgi:hypothetical protein